MDKKLKKAFKNTEIVIKNNIDELWIKHNSAEENSNLIEELVDSRNKFNKIIEQLSTTIDDINKRIKETEEIVYNS